MEIGPITPVRPVPMVKPQRAAVDLSGVFGVEFRKQADDETFSSSQHQSARGLEDEPTPEDDLQDDPDGLGTGMESEPSFASTAVRGKVSFFA